MLRQERFSLAVMLTWKTNVNLSGFVNVVRGNLVTVRYRCDARESRPTRPGQSCMPPDLDPGMEGKVEPWASDKQKKPLTGAMCFPDKPHMLPVSSVQYIGDQTLRHRLGTARTLGAVFSF